MFLVRRLRSFQRKFQKSVLSWLNWKFAMLRAIIAQSSLGTVDPMDFCQTLNLRARLTQLLFLAANADKGFSTELGPS